MFAWLVLVALVLWIAVTLAIWARNDVLAGRRAVSPRDRGIAGRRGHQMVDEAERWLATHRGGDTA